MNYLPESASIGPYTAALATFLQDRGHSVHVVTSFPMAPQWRVWDGYRGEWFRREVINGIPVRRTYAYVPADPRRTINRVLYDCSFSVSALAGCFGDGRYDIVIAISPPLQLGLTGWLVSRLFRVPLFFHIQDLVPDAAIATGLLSPESLSIRVARALERFVYRRAAGIGVICQGFHNNLVAKGLAPDKIHILPNSIDLNFMREHVKDNPFRRAHGLASDDIVLMYSGSIALKQGLEVMVDAAGLLTDIPKLQFVVVGEGPPLERLKQRAETRALQNIHFLPFQPRESLPEQLGAADALVITQRRAVTDFAFPGKLLYYMAAARPVLAAVSADSETGRFVAAQKVGLVTPPEDALAMAQNIRALLASDMTATGRRSRSVAEQLFDNRTVLPAFEEVLQSLVRSAGSSAVSGSAK